jgi:hypothetical protein
MENAKIYTSLCAIQKEIGVIGKDKKNQQQGFMFRGVDQVMNVLHPLLSEFGVFIVPEVVESHREERQTKSGGNLIYTIHKIKFHFTAMDGSEVCATVVGEGMDSADKSSNKAMAVAFKYACFQVFCVPTEEIAQEDPDNYMPEASTVSEAQLLRFIENCDSVADLRDLCNMYEANIKANPKAMAAYQAKKAEMKGSGK